MAAQRETYRAAWGDRFYRRAPSFGDLDAWREWQVGQMSANIAGLTRSEWA